MADSSATASSSQSGYVSVLVQGSSTLLDEDEFEDTHETDFIGVGTGAAGRQSPHQ